MCRGLPSTLSQAVYNFSLAFTYCFQRDSRLAAGENIGPFQVFSEHVHSPQHAYGRLDSQDHHSILFHSLSSQAFWLICCFPNCFLSPQAAVAKILACKNSQQMPPRKQLQHQASFELGKIKTSLLSQSSREPTDRSKQIILCQLVRSASSSTVRNMLLFSQVVMSCGTRGQGWVS